MNGWNVAAVIVAFVALTVSLVSLALSWRSVARGQFFREGATVGPADAVATAAKI
jgi:hypothetical protein